MDKSIFESKLKGICVRVGEIAYLSKLDTYECDCMFKMKTNVPSTMNLFQIELKSGRKLWFPNCYCFSSDGYIIDKQEFEKIDMTLEEINLQVEIEYNQLKWALQECY